MHPFIENVPDRIWADQDNLTWVEVDPTERMRDLEVEYIRTSTITPIIEAAKEVLDACDRGRLIELGAGGMTIEAQTRRSVYNGVAAWPVGELRTAILEYEGHHEQH